MSDQISQSASGIHHLIIDKAARDAQIRGDQATQTIQITYQQGEKTAGPLMVQAGEVAVVSGAIAVRVMIPSAMAVTIRKAYGDLRLQGLDADVSVETVAGDLRISDLKGIVRLAQVDGSVRADSVSDLRLMGSCGGDLRFREGGYLEAESIAGDLRLEKGIDARLDSIHGDLWAEQLSGKLNVHVIHGDARISDVSATVDIQDVQGDLRVTAVGGLSAARIAGDAIVHGPFRAGADYTLSADGDINVHLPEDPDVYLTARAAGRIRSDPALIPASDGSPSYTARVGLGSARLRLESGGDLRIRQEGATSQEKAEQVTSFGDLGDRIRRQVNASLTAAGIRLDPGEIIVGWGNQRRSASPPKSARSAAEQAKNSAADSSEQLAVLKMLEQGQITPEEADRLLKALGV